MEWKVKSFNELTVNELYEICKARFQVFTCGQRIYEENDFDDIDKKVYHLFLQDGDKVVAYARVIPKGITYEEAAIGRVLVLDEYRRRGIATELMKRSIEFLKRELKEDKIVISAQVYARGLYEAVGFRDASDIYNEVDIPHIKMILD
ncbi:GNAT family N-acetyltransferase [Clostridium vincentii]|uniref:Putative acyltransferase n=1 Tax=Clostridium vincentii TaxID=52704 RepID=A0A2T0B6X7_9CLOT|nr:GNAT family N-acetyltransferase [Clostridium vincentii]PRR79658.1 putative acyltransferase [Clostridium vincentii]